MGDSLWVSTGPDHGDILELIPGPYTGGPYIVDGEDDYNYIQILQYVNRTTGIIRRNLTASESYFGLDTEALWDCLYFHVIDGRCFQLSNSDAKRALRSSFRRQYRRTPTLRDLANYDIPRRGRNIIRPPNSYALIHATSLTDIDALDQEVGVTEAFSASDEEDLIRSVDESPEAESLRVWRALYNFREP